ELVAVADDLVDAVAEGAAAQLLVPARTDARAVPSDLADAVGRRLGQGRLVEAAHVRFDLLVRRAVLVGVVPGAVEAEYEPRLNITPSDSGTPQISAQNPMPRGARL